MIQILFLHGLEGSSLVKTKKNVMLNVHVKFINSVSLRVDVLLRGVLYIVIVTYDIRMFGSNERLLLHLFTHYKWDPV